jgi:uncharacterized membrane protein
MNISTAGSVTPDCVTDRPLVIDDDSGFRYRITPHRSLSERGFATFILAVVTTAVAAQVYFLLIGVWIAGVAAILDALFLIAAFTACRADGKQLETVTLRGGMICVERLNRNGKIISSAETPAFGLELLQTVDPDFGVHKVELLHHGRRLEIAAYLSPGERRSLTESLAHSLTVSGFSPRCTKCLLPTSPFTSNPT